MQLLYITRGQTCKKDGNKAVLVKLFLLRRHVYTEDLFHFGRERFFHVFLDTSEQERLEDFVEALVTIVPSFPVFVLKVLPGIKPAVHDRFNVPTMSKWNLN